VRADRDSEIGPVPQAERDQEFAARLEEATQAGYDRLEDIALERITDGIEKPIVAKGRSSAPGTSRAQSC
jgi:hypothetical protein